MSNKITHYHQIIFQFWHRTIFILQTDILRATCVTEYWNGEDKWMNGSKKSRVFILKMDICLKLASTDRKDIMTLFRLPIILEIWNSGTPIILVLSHKIFTGAAYVGNNVYVTDVRWCILNANNMRVIWISVNLLQPPLTTASHTHKSLCCHVNPWHHALIIYYLRCLKKH